MRRSGRERIRDRTGRVCLHARTCAFARLSDGPKSFDQPLSGPDQAALLEADQRRFSRTRFSAVIEADGVGAAGKDVFSVLAGRPRLRPESVFFRRHLVIVGVHPQQPCQPRALSLGRGLEMVVGQILPQCPPTTAASQLADDSRLTGRGDLLRNSRNGTGGASGTHAACLELMAEWCAPARVTIGGSAAAPAVQIPQTWPCRCRRCRCRGLPDRLACGSARSESDDGGPSGPATRRRRS